MLLDYVNIDIGTRSTYRQSKGNTLPLVQYPFGMQAIALQTDAESGNWFYNPSVDYAEGVRFTNQPSPWLGDYGNITIMPVNMADKLTCFDRHSTIKKHQFRADRMKIEFLRYQAILDIKPLKYGAEINLKFSSDNKYLLIDCFEYKNEIKCEGNAFRLKVWDDKERFGKHFNKYYYFDLDCEFNVIKKNIKNTDYYLLEFKNKDVNINLSTSYISFDQAKINQKQSGCSTQKWEELLSKFTVDEDSKTKTIFYSNLYRSLLYPHSFHEYSESGNPIYINLDNGNIEEGYMYVDVGFWDTYRTSMPFLKNYYPRYYKQIIEGILNFYKSYKWLPRWVSPIERGIMPSTLIDSVVAEAITSGVLSHNQQMVAIEALIKDGEVATKDELRGRSELESYINRGYISSEVCEESVSMTLDNAYCDYAIAKALEYVGDQRAKRYFERANNYKNLFNSQTNLFERKDDNGNFDEQFKPDEWGYDFCESSAWQNNFNVPHDIQGLIKMFGGKSKVIERLDFIFGSTPTYQVGRYGFEIHEMTEFASCNLGYFAISNQPSFLLPFVYLQVSEKEKFSEVIDRTLSYFTTDDYPGDEDNGSLSSWLLFVMLGKYPFCPVDNELICFETKYKIEIN